MKYIAQTGKEFNIKVAYYSSNNYYIIEVLEDGVKKGYLTFCIKKGQAWIYKIETKTEFSRQGVGKALIDTFEFILSGKRINSIDGKFYPDNEYAKPFYEKNGYQIYKDDYETYVCKYLDTQKVQEELQSRFVDFEITEEKEEELSR